MAQVLTNLLLIGLGLFIVDPIVRAHEGNIQVLSTEQDGTAFHLRVPRSVKSV